MKFVASMLKEIITNTVQSFDVLIPQGKQVIVLLSLTGGGGFVLTWVQLISVFGPLDNLTIIIFSSNSNV